jgi:hypothetical protein
MYLLAKNLLQKNVLKHRHEFSADTKQDLQNFFRETLVRIETKKLRKEESEKIPFLQKMFELLGYKLHQDLEFEFSTQGRSIDGVLGDFAGEDSNSPESQPQVAIEWKGIDTKSLDKGKAG